MSLSYRRGLHSVSVPMRREERPPSIDKLARAVNTDPSRHNYAVLAAREVVSGGSVGAEAVGAAEAVFQSLAQRSLGPVVNMSGVVLHTGLGRARLAAPVAEWIAAAMDSHMPVEFDMDSGERGDRQNHVRWLLQELTGCEDALVVNNCAGAVVLALAATAQGREVVLSRGQMVEIGGHFRMPEIIKSSGCTLVEVGCTNRTHLADYETAMSEQTGAVLRCHQSNFAQSGFVCSVEPRELARLAKAWSVPFIDDVGSGCLVDTLQYGLPRERTLREAVTEGADLVLASGDKLLGGPQAGIVLGSSEAVARLKRHALARALRVDKLTLGALEATLRLYFEGRQDEIPVWKYCARDLALTKRDASRLARAFPGRAEIAEGVTQIGGGSMPSAGVKTWCCGLTSGDADGLLTSLRSGGVIGRIADGKVWLDPRTAEPDETKATCNLLAGLGEWA